MAHTLSAQWIVSTADSQACCNDGLPLEGHAFVTIGGQSLKCGTLAGSPGVPEFCCSDSRISGVPVEDAFEAARQHTPSLPHNQ